MGAVEASTEAFASTVLDGPAFAGEPRLSSPSDRFCFFGFPEVEALPPSGLK